MQNWQKLMHFGNENGLKPLFGPLLALIGPILGPTKNYLDRFKSNRGKSDILEDQVLEHFLRVKNSCLRFSLAGANGAITEGKRE